MGRARGGEADATFIMFAEGGRESKGRGGDKKGPLSFYPQTHAKFVLSIPFLVWYDLALEVRPDLINCLRVVSFFLVPSGTFHKRSPTMDL